MFDGAAVGVGEGGGLSIIPATKHHVINGCYRLKAKLTKPVIQNLIKLARFSVALKLNFNLHLSVLLHLLVLLYLPHSPHFPQQ